MNFMPAIFCRSTLVALMLVAFFCTSSLAGFPLGGFNCGAECCQPSDPHASGAARFRLTSAQSMTCCGGTGEQTCDLQAPMNAQRQGAIQTIRSACSANAGVAAQRQVTRITDTHTGRIAYPQRSVSLEATPIYIEFQSIII
jgi:hypothetical protein